MSGDEFELPNPESPDKTKQGQRVELSTSQVEQEAGEAMQADRGVKEEIAKSYGVEASAVEFVETEGGGVRAVVSGASWRDKETDMLGEGTTPASDPTDDVKFISDGPRSGPGRYNYHGTAAPTQEQRAIMYPDDEVYDALTKGGFLSQGQEEKLEGASQWYNRGANFVAGNVGGAVDTVVRPFTGEKGETAAGAFVEGGTGTVAQLGNLPAWAKTAEGGAEYVEGMGALTLEGKFQPGLTASAELGGAKGSAFIENLRENPYKVTGGLLAGTVAGYGVSSAALRGLRGAGGVVRSRAPDASDMPAPGASMKANVPDSLKQLWRDERAQMQLGKTKKRGGGTDSGKSKVTAEDLASGGRARSDIDIRERIAQSRQLRERGEEPRPDFEGSAPKDPNARLRGRGRAGDTDIDIDTPEARQRAQNIYRDVFGEDADIVQEFAPPKQASLLQRVSKPELTPEELATVVGVPASTLVDKTPGDSVVKPLPQQVGDKTDTQPPGTGPESGPKPPSGEEPGPTGPGDGTLDTEPGDLTDTTPGQSVDPNDGRDLVPPDEQPVPPWERNQQDQEIVERAPDQVEEMKTRTRWDEAILRPFERRQSEAQRRRVTFGQPDALDGQQDKVTQQQLSKDRDALDLLDKAQQASLSSGAGVLPPKPKPDQDLDVTPREIEDQGQPIAQLPEVTPDQDDDVITRLDTPAPPITIAPPTTTTTTPPPGRPTKPPRRPRTPLPPIELGDTDTGKKKKKKKSGASDVFDNPAISPEEAVDFDPFEFDQEDLDL